MKKKEDIEDLKALLTNIELFKPFLNEENVKAVDEVLPGLKNNFEKNYEEYINKLSMYDDNLL